MPFTYASDSHYDRVLTWAYKAQRHDGTCVIVNNAYVKGTQLDCVEVDYVARQFANALIDTNDKFDKERFLKACRG